MVIPITPKQLKKINVLIKKFCCNYVDGYCLLLDDGEEHSCVQCISRYGIYCDYFKKAVLSADKELFTEIMHPTSRKRCQICKRTLYRRRTINGIARTALPSKSGRKPSSASTGNGRRIRFQDEVLTSY